METEEEVCIGVEPERTIEETLFGIGITSLIMCGVQ